MGCRDSRLITNYDENTIDYAEKALGIHNLNAKMLIEKLRRFSHNGCVNRNQLEFLAQKYSLHIDNYDNHKRITDLYRSLLNESTQDIDLNVLIMIVILLGKGNSHQKAKLIFEAFDPALQNALSESQLEEIFDTMYWISIKKLPDLVCESKIVNADLTRHEDYLRKLSSARYLAYEDFHKKIMGTSSTIDKSTFVERFIKINSGDLTNSIGFRLYLKSYEGKVIAKKYHNPFDRKFSHKFI